MTAKTFSRRLYEILKPFRRVIATIALFLLLAQLLQMASPYILGRIVNAYLGKATIWKVAQLGLLGFLVFLTKNFLGLERELFELHKFDNSIGLHLSEMTMTRLFAWSIAQHRRQHTGLTQSIIVDGEQSLSNAATLITYDVFEVMSQMVLTIGMIFWISSFLGCVMLAVVLLFSFTTYKLNMHIRKDLLTYEERKHAVAKSYIEIQRNAQLVLAQAQEEREKAACQQAHSDLREYGEKVWVWYCKWASARNVQLGLGELAVIVLGAYMISTRGYAPGIMVTFIFWARDLFGKMYSIGPIVRKSYRLWPAIVAYLELLDTQPELVPDSDPVSPAVIHGKIAARHVTFWHDNEDAANPTLVDMSFIIKPGEKIGVVGPSGAGKSTLVNLLLRATDPSEGSILIDDVDLRRYNLQRYRRAVGFVEQHVPILDRTLRDNILFGRDDADNITRSQLEEIAQLCRIDEFMDTLPNGFETMLGEQGVRLSGGQCQRVGIARALVKNPAILIFDEATSHLDSENEFLVHEAIDRVSKGRTTIMIAHRLSTVRDCDRILVIENGRLMGLDAHDRLLATCLAYGTLVQRQVIQ